MSNNFRMTAFLIKKKKLLTEAKKQRILLKNFVGVSVLKFLQRLAFHISVCIFSRDFLTDKCIENLKSGSRPSRRMKRPEFFSVESVGVKL